jgi:carboxymethylenebutenolidase
MQKKDIRIPSTDGGEFDCYVVTPAAKDKTPAVVLASAIHGVDQDLRSIADEFASRGYIAAAPDLFWRTPTPGPLKRDDPRSAPRGQPRLERIKAGERDIADVLPVLRKEPLFNGRAAVIGFCYGGPFAVLGPKRLGYDAGISCHGTQLLDFIGEFEGLRKPVCLVWGDKDHVAPPNVLEAYRLLAARMKNVELHVFPGVEHGYMMSSAPAYDRKTYEFSMARALAILESLRDKRSHLVR